MQYIKRSKDCMSVPTCWSQLAQELLLYIFSGLNCKTWVRLSGVCRRWRNIILNTPEGRAKRTAFSWMYVTPVIEKRTKPLETTDFNNVRVVDIRDDIFLVMLKREYFASNVLIYEKYQDWDIMILDGGIFDGRVTDQFVVLLYHRHLQFYLSAWDRASREIVWTSDEIRIRSPQIAVQNSTILFWNSGETQNCTIEVFVLNEDGTLRNNYRSTPFSPNFLDGNMQFQYPHILMSGGQDFVLLEINNDDQELKNVSSFKLPIESGVKILEVKMMFPFIALLKKKVKSNNSHRIPHGHFCLDVDVSINFFVSILNVFQLVENIIRSSDCDEALEGLKFDDGRITFYSNRSIVSNKQTTISKRSSRDNFEIYNVHALPLTERKNDGDSMNNELQCRIIDLGSNVTGQVSRSFNTQTSHINVALYDNVLVFKKVRFELDDITLSLRRPGRRSTKNQE